MGDWHISIQGTGIHHNQGDPKDADVLADQFVQQLLEAGQRVDTATFTSGGRLVLATSRPAKTT